MHFGIIASAKRPSFSHLTGLTSLLGALIFLYPPTVSAQQQPQDNLTLPAGIQKEGVTATAESNVFNAAFQKPKWNINPNQVNYITVYLDNTPPKSSSQQAVYTQYLNQALEDWSTASRGTLQFIKVDHPDMAQIHVKWLNNKHRTPFGIVNNEVARTTLATTPEGNIAQAGIFITPKRLEASMVRTMLLREVGIALGLTGDQKLETVMCESGTFHCIQVRRSENQPKTYLPQLTLEDASQLRALYRIPWQTERLTPQGKDQRGTDITTRPEIRNKYKYLSTMSEDIRNHWHPGQFMNLPVMVRLTLDPIGRLINAEVKESSHVAIADQLALEAVEAAAPYAPFPKDYHGKILTVDFYFKPED